jgi:hypothetical protein
MHQMDRLARVGREREVALDDEALAEGRVAADPELGRDRSGVNVRPFRQGRLLAVAGEPPARDRVVGERAPISVSSAPACALVIEARKPVGTIASARARSTSPRTSVAESTTGSVFGIARIAQ